MWEKLNDLTLPKFLCCRWERQTVLLSRSGLFGMHSTGLVNPRRLTCLTWLTRQEGKEGKDSQCCPHPDLVLNHLLQLCPLASTAHHGFLFLAIVYKPVCKADFFKWPDFSVMRETIVTVKHISSVGSYGWYWDVGGQTQLLKNRRNTKQNPMLT